jgi:hypothetical protein
VERETGGTVYRLVWVSPGRNVLTTTGKEGTKFDLSRHLNHHLIVLKGRFSHRLNDDPIKRLNT